MASSSDRSRRGFKARLLWWWVGVCGLVGASLCLSQLIEIPARSALRGYDNTFNYLWLRSAMVDRDWDFRNDLIAGNTLTPEYRAAALNLPPTSAGRIPNKYGVGWALLTVPFYLVADLLVSLGRAAGAWSYQNDGFNPIYQVCIQLGHAGLAVVALALAVLTVSAWLGNRGTRPSGAAYPKHDDGSDAGSPGYPRSAAFSPAAVFGVISVWAASPLIYYQTANVSMSHGAAFFAVALMAFALVRGGSDREAYRWWLMVGAGWGLAVIVRYQLAAFVLPVIWTLCGLRHERRILLRAIFLIGLGAAPFLLLQGLAWHRVYGEWLVFSYGAEGESFHWGRPEIWKSLFSSWHGLLYWHPFVLFGLGGLMAWVWETRKHAMGWALSFLLILYTNAAWWCWWFASSFGNRGYDAALLPLMAGVAWLFHRLDGVGRKILWATAIAFALWNFYVVLLYRTAAISRNEPVTWMEMIEAATRLGEALKF